MNVIPYVPTSLGDVTTSVNRGLSSSYLKDGEIPVRVIKAKDITDDGILIVETIDQETVRSIRDINKAKVRKGDVLITLKGTNFKAAVVKDDIDNLVISANIIAITLDHIRVLPEIVAFYLNSTTGQQELQKRAGGSVVQTLNRNFLMEVPIPIPPMPIQEKLCAYLRSVQKYLIILEKERETINKLTNVVARQIMEEVS